MDGAARRWLALLAPLLFLAAASWLSFHIAVDQSSLRVSRGRFGPGFWPGLMLAGIAVCAAGWFLRNAFRPRRIERDPAAGEGLYRNGRAAVGIGLVVLYGVLIPPIGFAFATLLFVLAWMLLGGVRRPLTVVLVGGLGTAALLWFFAGVALMPLDLGKGPFESATVALYRLLRIY